MLRLSTPTFCVSRWIENIDGLKRFSMSHPFLVEMFKVIFFLCLSVFNDSWFVEDNKMHWHILK